MYQQAQTGAAGGLRSSTEAEVAFYGEKLMTGGSLGIPSNSIFQSLLADLAEATSVARDIDITMRETRVRLFGPWPEKGEASNTASPVAPSIEAQIGEAVSYLRNQLLSAREHASVVSNRL